MQRERVAKLVFVAPLVAGLVAYLLLPPIRQSENYHHFADGRTFLGIPNCLNVLSNVPFAVVGVAGLVAFRDLVSRVLFGGIALVAVGSAYYHLHPDTARLVWDRAPMTIAFMAILALLVEEFWSERAGRAVLFPSVCLGLFSVWWWQVSGDLRFYGIVQFGPMLAIVAALVVFQARQDRALWFVFGLYGVAKLAENFDGQVLQVLAVSGHTLKHLLAGFAAYWIFRWRRNAVESRTQSPEEIFAADSALHKPL